MKKLFNRFWKNRTKNKFCKRRICFSWQEHNFVGNDDVVFTHEVGALISLFGVELYIGFSYEDEDPDDPGYVDRMVELRFLFGKSLRVR